MIAFDRALCVDPARTVRALSDGRIALLGDREHTFVEGPGLATVLGLIDGIRSKEDVLRCALLELDELTALTALHRLEHSGCVVAVPPPPWRSDELAFFRATGSAPPWTCDASVHVLAIDVPEDTAEVARRALRDLGIAATATAPHAADLTVLITRDYLSSALRAAVDSLRDHAPPFCVVQPSGRAALFGPIVSAQGTPCWDCLCARLRSQSPLREALAARGDEDARSMPWAATATSLHAVLSLTMLQIARFLVTPSSTHPLCTALYELDHARLELRAHALKVAGCSACRARRIADGARIDLQPIRKALPHEGGFRCMSAEQVLQRCEHLVSARLGPITHLTPLAGRDRVLRPVYASGYVVPVDAAQAPERCVRTCAGKGRSRAQARASALSEALERLSGQWRGDEATSRASLRELGELAVAPRALHGFSEAQYARRDTSEACDRASFVDAPLPDERAIDWVAAWSLTHERVRYVPLSYCYADAPLSSGRAYCGSTGNGVAAGSCLEEAILQGLLELVERDAVAIWWYNMLRRPCLPLDAVRDPALLAMIESYRDEGRTLTVFDLTHDLQLPVFAAVTLAKHAGELTLGLGFGCHLLPELAFERALTELNQIGDGRHPITGRAWLDTRGLRDTHFLEPHAGTSQRLDDRYDSPDLAVDVRACVERLRARDVEVLVVDKSRAELDMKVAHVIAPGLRHFWPRFAPGRLYEVPVAQGLLRVPRAESELNPVPLVL